MGIVICNEWRVKEQETASNAAKVHRIVGFLWWYFFVSDS
jgi:hypothetical protein